MKRCNAQVPMGAFIPRWVMWPVLCAVAAAAWLLAANWRARPGNQSWNVVLITLDTTRADRLGCYGSRNETPTIDALARRGVRFENCYAPVPLTLPSHCSLMTGLTPLRHGVRDNGPDRLSPSADTLAEILSRHGYATAAILGAVPLDRKFGLDQGFAYYDDQMPQGPADNPFRCAERRADEVTDAALEWLSRRPRQPIFLWVHYFDAHAPYAPPKFDPAFATASAYDAEIQYVDSQLKRLLDGVQQQVDGPTLVILTADHGEALGQHGELTHGLFTYNATLRVPLVVLFPADLHAGRVIRTPVGLVDVAPSLLAWLGLSESALWDGVPLPLERRATQDADEPRPPVYFENQYPTVVFGWSGVEGIVAGRYKLIRAPKPELYDLGADPGERNNLFESSSDRSSQLVARLDSIVTELAARPALRSQPAEINRADVARLQSLGYVGVRSPANAEPESTRTGLPDAKDMIDVYAQLQEIAVLIQQRQIDRANQLLLEILTAKDPRNRRALRYLAAFSLDEPAFHDRAIDILMEAARHGDHPTTDPYVLGKLGVTLMADERFAESAAVFARLLELDPQSAAACRYRADVERQLGNAAEAARWNQRAQELAKPGDEAPDWAAEPGLQRARLPIE